MNTLSLRVLVLAGSIVGMASLAAQSFAVTFHWRGVTVAWTGETRYDNQGNPYFVPAWVETGYPSGAADDAVIQAGGTCSVNVDPSIRSLLLDDPTAVLHSPGRTWNLGAAMTLSRGTMNLWGGSVTTVSGLTNAATMMVQHVSSVAGPFTNSGLIDMGGSSIYGNAYLAAPSIVNTGTVRMNCVNGGYSAYLTTNLANEPAGSLSLVVGGGGNRYFAGTLTNKGSIASEAVNFEINGTWTNTGTASFGGPTWMTGTGNTLNMNSGSISVPGGPLMLYGTVANLTAGTLSGTIVLENGALNFSNGSTIQGHVRTRAASTLSGKIPTGMTVQIAGDSYVGNSSLAVGGASNAGNLVMESFNGGYSQFLNGDFTNDASGKIRLNAGSGGIQYINSNLTNAGTLTATQTGGQIRGSLTNTGTVTVGEGASLQFYDASTLNQNGGVIDGGPFFWMHGGFVNLNGGAVTGNTGTRSSSIAINQSVTGALRAFADNSVSGTIGPSFELRGQGSSWVGDALLTCTNVTNKGKITLETDNGGYASSIAGTVTNAPTGVLATKVGGGGYRRFTGTFTNQGTMRVDGSPSEFRGTLTNTGALQVVNGGWVHTLDNSIVNMNGGTLSADSEFWMYGGTLALNAGALSGRVGIHSGTITINPVVSGALEAYASCNISGTIGTGMVVRGAGSSWLGHSMLVAGPLTNHGRLVLETATGGYNSDLQGDLTNASDGSYELLKGGGGNRLLYGTLVNQGAMKIQEVHSQFRGTFTNNGKIDMVGGNMGLYDNSTFNMNGGSVKTDGYLWAHGGTYNLKAGTLQGTVGIYAGTINFLPGSTIQGNVFAQTAVNLNGTVNAGASVTAQGNSGNGHATIVSNGAKNAGQVILETSNGGYDSNLSGTFQNLASGLFQMKVGGGGRRQVDADVVNDGSIVVDAGVPSYQWKPLVNNGSISVAGTMSIQSAGAFTLNKGTVAAPGWIWGYGRPFQLFGGAITGTIGMDHGSIDFGADSKTTGTVVARGAVGLTGKNATGMTVRCEGASYIGHSRLDCSGLQNRGSLVLETLNGGYNSDLAGTMNNLPSGRIYTRPGAGGWRTLTWTMDNLGLVEIESGTSLTNTGADHINGGTLRIKNGVNLHFGGASFTNDSNALIEGTGGLVMNGLTLANDGTINPGLSQEAVPVGSLGVGGNLIQSAGGTLGFEVGGTAAGQFDTLAVTGNILLDGALIARAGGYVPRPGDRFRVLTWTGTRTGAFSTPPNPEYWQMEYGAKYVEVIRIKRLLGDADGDDAVTVFDYNLLSAAFDSVPGDPNWDPRCDFDEDEAITVFDYNILSENFDVSV